MGDGGGAGEPDRVGPGDAVGSGGGGDGDLSTAAIRLAFEALDFALVVDLTDTASLLSTPLLVSMLEIDVLGLSILPLPGILERMEPRKERVEPWVSDLLNDGKDCRGPSKDLSSDVEEAFVGVLEPSFAFDWLLPILRLRNLPRSKFSVLLLCYPNLLYLDF